MFRSSPREATSSPAYLSLLFRRKKGASFSRHFQRFECALIGEMEALDIGAAFEGAVLELSAGGCSFRPASMFLLDRLGESVSIRTSYFSCNGRIRAVRTGSYGVQFAGPLSSECLERVLADHGGRTLDMVLDESMAAPTSGA